MKRARYTTHRPAPRDPSPDPTLLPSEPTTAARVIIRPKGSTAAGELHQGTRRLQPCPNCPPTPGPSPAAPRPTTGHP